VIAETPAEPDGGSRAAESDGGSRAAESDGGSRLFGRGLLYVVVWSLQLVVSTLVSPVLTHLVGPAEFGALSSALAVYQVLSVAALLGLDQALVLERADEQADRNAAGTNTADASRSLRSRGLVTVAVVISFLVTALALATIPLWSGALGFADFPVLIVAVILWTGPSASVTVMLALLVAEDRLKAFILVGVISAVGGSIVGLGLILVLDRDASTYAWGGVICQFVAMFIGFAVVRPSLAGFRQWEVTKRAIRLGVPLALGSLAFFVLNAGDRIILQRELGAVEVGRYQIAYVIGSAVILLLNFTNGAWTPHFASLKTDRARMSLAMRSRDELYRILVPIVLGVTLIAPLALRVLAPASFRPDGLTVVVLVVALTSFPVAASGSTGRLLVVARRGKTVGLIAGVAAVLNIVLNLILVPTSLGIAGAAVATLASYAVLAVLQWWFLPDRRSWHGAPAKLVALVGVAVAVAAVSTAFPQTLEWNLGRAGLAVACFPWFLLRLRAARRDASAPAGMTPDAVATAATDDTTPGDTAPDPVTSDATAPGRTPDA
jgi:O-antigen/teichoic acid export membrane protein